MKKADERFRFWQRWLTWANIITVCVGLVIAFAGNSFILDIHNDYTRGVFFNNQPFSDQELKLKNWLFGIIGGTIVGFHLLMIMISENAFKNKEPWGYNAMWLGLLSWFIIDTSISLFYGAVHNVLLINLVALILIGLPLIMTKNDFKEVRQN